MSERQTANNRPLIVALIAIGALLFCCFLAVVGLAIAGILTLPWSGLADTPVQATEKIDEIFNVSTPAFLSLDVNLGDVVIQVGDGDEVRVYAVKHAWGRDRGQAEEYLDDFEVRIDQSGTGEVTIETETPPRLRQVGRAPSVDLEISVPRETNLDINLNVGNLKVTDVEGIFEIDSNVGDITLRNVRFEGDSQIESDVGNIELGLPTDSAFAFSAESNVGSIRVEFPVRNERWEKKVVGESVEGEIGTSPTVYVELHTNTGDIRIRRD